MKKLRVLMLMDAEFVPPDDIEQLDPEARKKVRAEWDVFSTLRDLGHEVRKVGLYDDLAPIRDAVTDFKPHVAFNLLEGFRDFHVFDQHVVAYLELIDQRYTGCNPRGLTIARDKALTKKIMAYHRIHAPAFAVFPRGRRITRPKKLKFPLLVKSINVEGSVGIAQASVVDDEQKLRERVQFIHDHLGTAAIAEQYIQGREVYIGMLGNQRLRTLPAWEMFFEKANKEMHCIATDKAKWDPKYQDRWGIMIGPAANLPEDVKKQIPNLCRRIYRNLGLTGYARLDFRLTEQGQMYLIEANPNPQIAQGEEFAESAREAGIAYPQLIQQILKLGLSHRPESVS